MAGHVDEGRIDGRDLIDHVDDVADGLAPRRGNDLETEKGIGRLVQVFYDVHDFTFAFLIEIWSQPAG